MRDSVGVNKRPGGKSATPLPKPPKKLSSELNTTLGSMMITELPRSGPMRIMLTARGGFKSCRYSLYFMMRTRVGFTRGLVRKTSSKPILNIRMKRSLIMSIEETLTPRLLSSLARSCLRTRTLVLNPVSVSIEPSRTPSERAASSSSESRLAFMRLASLLSSRVDLLHHKRGEENVFDTAKVFVLHQNIVHHDFDFGGEFTTEVWTACFGLGRLTHLVQNG